MWKKAKVLLLKPLPGKGNAGEVVDVKVHFANQVLVPQGVAIYFDKQTENQRDAQLKKIEKNKADIRNRVEEIITKLSQDGITLEKAATEADKLYESISAKTLVNYMMTEFQLPLTATNFGMEEKIEMVGQYQIPFVYESISAVIPLTVIKKV